MYFNSRNSMQTKTAFNKYPNFTIKTKINKSNLKTNKSAKKLTFNNQNRIRLIIKNSMKKQGYKL